MNINSFFNPQEALEQGQTLLKKQTQATAQAVKGQITGQTQPPTLQDTAKAGGGAPDKITQDFISDMYAPSDPIAKTQQTQPASTVQSQLLAKPAGTDQAKLAEARKKLEEHKKQHIDTYYKPTFEGKPKGEERPAEKVEREEQEEQQKRWELHEKEQKKNEVPIALRMAKNKTEMFRGAAG